jgi:DNA-binding response OmpR family regulator
VVDRVLPDADGVEFCHEVRRHDSRAYIFLLSALDSADAVAKGLAAGADDCLSKLASDGELLEQLKRAELHAQRPAGHRALHRENGSAG